MAPGGRLQQELIWGLVSLIITNVNHVKTKSLRGSRSLELLKNKISLSRNKNLVMVNRNRDRVVAIGTLFDQVGG